MDKIARIIDANCNRTREGMRVIEEIARFLMDDKDTFADIKTLRHKFTDIEIQLRASLPYCTIARDSLNDVGNSSMPELENNRPNISSIIEANCNRIAESLRVLEEFTKIADTKFVSDIKKIRFEVYNLEKVLKRGLLEK